MTGSIQTKHLIHRDLWSVAPSGSVDAMDTVLAVRVQLARNILDLPFYGSQTSSQAREVLAHGEVAIRGAIPWHNEGMRMSPSSKKLEQQIGLDRGLIETEIDQYQQWFGEKDFSSSIFINGQDHLLFTGWAHGLELQRAYLKAKELESVMDSRISFAASLDFGYLTSKILEAGLGLRAMAIVHLPALSDSGAIPVRISDFSMISHPSLPPESKVFLVLGTGVLGETEREFLDTFSEAVFQIVFEERKTREELRRADALIFDDEIWRARGLIENHRRITSAEASKAWSFSRLGWSMEIIPHFPWAAMGLPLRLTDAHVWASLSLHEPDSSTDQEKRFPKSPEMTILDEERSALIRQTLIGGMENV
jgi:protein arginine kinase